MRHRILLTAAATAVLATAAAPAVAATGPAPAPLIRPHGVDVSGYQHPNGWSIDWAKVHGAGQTFAFVKATESTDYTNSYFAADWSGLWAVGMARGAYHFARPAVNLQTAVDQARHYLAVTGTMQVPGALPPMLDLEESGGLSPSQLIAWTRTWLDTVQQATGRKPVIYTYPYFWQSAMANTSAFTSYPLFIASYSAAPQLVGGWPSWTFWQYTDNGYIPGMPGPVDMDHYAGGDNNVMAITWGRGAAAAPAVGPLSAYRNTWLRPGATGPAVVALQRALHVTADGQLGPQTATAVIAFKRTHGRPADAIVGPATWTALITAAALDPYRYTWLQPGATGPAVVALQRALHVTADGQLGPQTAAAVIAFKRTHSRPADPIVGPATWNALGA